MNELDGTQMQGGEDPSLSGTVGGTHYFRNLAIGAVALLFVCGGIVVLSTSGSDDPSGDETAIVEDEPAETTIALDPDEICIKELSEWLPWVTGPGTTLDAAAEWGMQSEEYRIVVDGWSEFQRQLYQVGSDEASGLAYGAIDRGCRAMTYDYEPGHLPPG